MFHGVRLLLELFCVIVIKYVAFAICAKLLVTMAFTFTFLDVIVDSDLKKNIDRWTDLLEKMHGSADFHTPSHPPLYEKQF